MSGASRSRPRAVSDTEPGARFNRYTCADCGGQVVTIDRDDGVTPFLIDCRVTPACPGLMRSAFYRDVAGVPTFAWCRPTPAEYRRLTRAAREHVDRGGLLLYAITDETGAESDSARAVDGER